MTQVDTADIDPAKLREFDPLIARIEKEMFLPQRFYAAIRWFETTSGLRVIVSPHHSLPPNAAVSALTHDRTRYLILLSSETVAACSGPEPKATEARFLVALRVAHELGHIVLDHLREMDFLSESKIGDASQYSNQYVTYRQIQEDEADRFAAALLHRSVIEIMRPGKFLHEVLESREPSFLRFANGYMEFIRSAPDLQFLAVNLPGDTEQISRVVTATNRCLSTLVYMLTLESNSTSGTRLQAAPTDPSRQIFELRELSYASPVAFTLVPKEAFTFARQAIRSVKEILPELLTLPLTIRHERGKKIALIEKSKADAATQKARRINAEADQSEARIRLRFLRRVERKMGLDQTLRSQGLSGEEPTRQLVEDVGTMKEAGLITAEIPVRQRRARRSVNEAR